ncbi:hypothetical protein EU538_08570 [Candidatus Thorarchaeota archaeon]|nr:MAG: hypothetical protein EU538_08570 [Candidatus Thorarchaeota archaeon]
MTAEPVLKDERHDTTSRIERLGRTVSCRSALRFKQLIESDLTSNRLDITDWTLPAVVALIEACRENELRLWIKRGSREMLLIVPPPAVMTTIFANWVLKDDRLDPCTTESAVPSF